MYINCAGILVCKAQFDIAVTLTETLAVHGTLKRKARVKGKHPCLRDVVKVSLISVHMVIEETASGYKSIKIFSDSVFNCVSYIESLPVFPNGFLQI